MESKVSGILKNAAQKEVFYSPDGKYYRAMVAQFARRLTVDEPAAALITAERRGGVRAVRHAGAHAGHQCVGVGQGGAARASQRDDDGRGGA